MARIVLRLLLVECAGADEVVDLATDRAATAAGVRGSAKSARATGSVASSYVRIEMMQATRTSKTELCPSAASSKSAALGNGAVASPQPPQGFLHVEAFRPFLDPWHASSTGDLTACDENASKSRAITRIPRRRSSALSDVRRRMSDSPTRTALAPAALESQQVRDVM